LAPTAGQDQDDERLWREAMEHVLAVRGLAADPGARQAAARWRGSSARHEAAYREAERVWHLAGRVPPAHAHRWAGRRAASLARRRFVLGGAGALAASVLAVAVLPDAIHRLRGDEATGIAEIRTLELADGSRITLGPDSSVRVALDGGGRNVELVDGMAFFEVAADAGRPFLVRHGGLTVRVVGTAFEVRRMGARLSVAVDRGAVGVSNVGAPALADRRLGPGEWLAVDGAAGTVESGRAALDHVAAWRDSMMVVERRPVSEVAAEIGRWHPGTIVTVDDRLGARRVSGVFDLRDPVTALQAVVEPYGGHVRRLTRWVLVLDAG
jgi:transmembrane sensor